MSDVLDERLAVVEMIVTCTRCELHAQCTSPVPFSGPTPARLAIVGEAPGAAEDTGGEPFIGPAGKLLRELILEVDLDPRAMFMVNTAQCFPHGTPEPEHVAACRPNKLAALDLAAPEFVLAVGTTALNGFRTEVGIGKARRRPFKPLGAEFVVFPTYHPSAALRNRLYHHELQGDLKVYAELVAAGRSRWHEWVHDDCLQCGAPVWFFDEQGWGWCSVHLPPEGVERRKLLEADYAAAKARTR
jgi:uracil-DNA glycosylase